MTTAIVAQTKTRAKRIADELGIDRPQLFGAQMARAFEGLRADRVLIDAEATISDDFLSTIHATTRKMPGGGLVRFVALCEDVIGVGRPAPRGVKVLGPFQSWLTHTEADSWKIDAEGRLVVTAAGEPVALYNSWVSVELLTAS